MQIKDSVVFITGASGGIGSCLVEAALNRGARKIYAADLKLESVQALQAKHGDSVVPVQLDVTKLEAVQACHQTCHDANILINNAGVEFATSFLNERALKCASIEMAVNYLGVHALCHQFWPSLRAMPRAAIINILSVASFHYIPNLGTYSASKAAAHYLTQGLRLDSAGTGIEVFGVYPGYVDTDMIKNLDVEKASPQLMVDETLNEVEASVLDIYPDVMSKGLAKSLFALAQ